MFRRFLRTDRHGKDRNELQPPTHRRRFRGRLGARRRLRALRRLRAALASLLLTTALISGFAVSGNAGRREGHEDAQPRDKMSIDLRERVRKSRGNEKMTVIVQPKGAWADEHEGAVTAHGGRVKKKFENLNERVVELDAAAVEALAARDDVAYVSPDRQMYALGHVSLTVGADAARAMDTTKSSTAENNSTANAPLIKIAILDSGLDTWHRSLYNAAGSSTRAGLQYSFTGTPGTLDEYGHGTHVASAAVGSALVAGGAYKGAASDAPLVGYRVLDGQGRGSVSGLLQALDHILTNRVAYNIRVVNMSLGMPAVDSYRDDPVCKAVRRLVDAGVVVVVAAGNDGKDANGRELYGRVHSPGIEPSAITVGASNTFGTDSRADDAVATYSSRGPTRGYRTDLAGIKHYDNLIKPDLVAPGNKVVWAASANNLLLAQNPQLNAFVSDDKTRNMMTLNGTSMAAPLVAGAAALVLRHNPRLTPNMVKMILQYTAQPLNGFNVFEQGAGQLNVEGAVRLAKAIRIDLPQYWNPATRVTMPVGTPLLKSGVAAPPAQTTIADHTFTWSQGVVLDHTTAWSPELITKYQKVYGTGVLMGDATLLDATGVLLSDPALMTSGVLMGDQLLTSTGITISEGLAFLGVGVLLGDGVLLSDGVLMSDNGVLISDGVLLSDGVFLSDGVLLNDVTTQGQAATLSGDNTAAMAVVKEAGTSTAGTTTLPKRK